MPKYPELQGARVVLTGGAQGIGEAMLRRFVAEGARVDFCDLEEERGRALARELGEAARFRKVDLASERSVEAWLKAVAAAGPVDVVLNNAARDPRLSVAQTTGRDWDALFAVNLKAMFLMVRSLEKVLRSPGASIVNFSSITFHLGPSEMPAYVATKGGVQGLTRALARDLGGRGIRVNTLSPGWVMTERQVKEFVTPAVKRQLKKEQCLPGLLAPDDIAEVALFLGSGASRGMTGQELLVDHGWRFS